MIVNGKHVYDLIDLQMRAKINLCTLCVCAVQIWDFHHSIFYRQTWGIHSSKVRMSSGVEPANAGMQGGLKLEVPMGSQKYSHL
jgi:hypothetical protein